MAKPEIVEQHYVLAVPDIQATARWWIDHTRFEIWMEPDG